MSTLLPRKNCSKLLKIVCVGQSPKDALQKITSQHPFNRPKSIQRVRFFSASVLRFSLRFSARPVRGSETCRADARFRRAPPRRAQKPRAHVHRPTSRGARRSRGRRAAIGARGERRVGAAHAPETRRSRLHLRGRRRAPGDRGDRFRRRTRRTRTRRTGFPRRFPPRVRVHGGVHALFVRRFVRREEMFDRSDVRDLPRTNGESAKSARPARRGATTREPGKSRAAGPERRVRGGHQARASATATRRRRRRRRRSDAFSCRRRAGGRVRMGKQEPVRVGAVDTLQAANRDRVGTSRERLSVFFTPLPARFLFFFTRRVFWVFYFFQAAHA